VAREGSAVVFEDQTVGSTGTREQSDAITILRSVKTMSSPIQMCCAKCGCERTVITQKECRKLWACPECDDVTTHEPVAETVYISEVSTTSRKYHTNPDCERMPERNREIERDKLNQSYEQCSICDGEYNNGGGTYDKDTCPLCGAEIKVLAKHLPCDE